MTHPDASTGKIGRGKPKETWVRTRRREAGEECWSDVEELAHDRWCWREFVGTLGVPLSTTGAD